MIRIALLMLCAVAANATAAPLTVKVVLASEPSLNATSTLLLGEKEPSLQFTTPEQLGAMAVFFCSAAAANVRGQAWANDGGWTAQ